MDDYNLKKCECGKLPKMTRPEDIWWQVKCACGVTGSLRSDDWKAVSDWNAGKHNTPPISMDKETPDKIRVTTDGQDVSFGVPMISVGLDGKLIVTIDGVEYHPHTPPINQDDAKRALEALDWLPICLNMTYAQFCDSASWRDEFNQNIEIIRAALQQPTVADAIKVMQENGVEGPYLFYPNGLQQPPMGVDLDALRLRDDLGVEFNVGWNSCIEHIIENGHLRTPAQAGWKPIDEEPDNDSVVLCYWPGGHMQFARYSDGKFWFQSTRGNHMVGKVGFTHWMDKPAAPEAAGV